MRDLLAIKSKAGHEQRVKVLNITCNSDGDLKKLVYLDEDGNIDEDSPEYFKILERLPEEE